MGMQSFPRRSSDTNAPRLPQTLAQMDTTGLVASWLLDGSLTDLVSGRALTRVGTWNATSNNMIWDIELNQYVPVFTGANYYTFPLTEFPANTAAQTLMSWAKARATDQGLVCAYNSHVGGMHYGGLSATGDTSTQTGLNLLSDGTWHHLASVFNGATRNFYVDGVLHYSAAESPTYTYATGAIGAYVVGNLKLVGYVAGVRCYSSAKTAAEILAIAKREA